MSNAIPLAKPSLSEAERQAVLDVLQSPVLASGPRVEHFAKSIAELTERDCGIPCSSGTAGLTLVLAALGIGAGDKVVVPAFGFVAMANAVWSLGATPLFADCDPRTLNVDLESVAQLLELKPRAVLAAETRCDVLRCLNLSPLKPTQDKCMRGKKPLFTGFCG